MYALDRKTLETIYFSFMRPKLEYASIVWDDCNSKEKNLLERCQLRALRIVTGGKKGTSHAELYNETSWNTLESRRKKNKIEFAHKILNKNAPDYLVEILPTTVNHHNLRNNNNLKQFKFRTEKFRKSLLPDCIRLWNGLSLDQRGIECLDKFKASINNNFKKSENNPLYNFGERKINIVHAQLRMGCSNLNSHLFNLHVIDEPKCSCSYRLENNAHFFMDCKLYHNQRLNLIANIIPFCSFELNVLLYGSKVLSLTDNLQIFSFVHEFIKESGRFI